MIKFVDKQLANNTNQMEFNAMERSNTIKPIEISGEEYVIIKNLKKEYDIKKNELIQKIYLEMILENKPVEKTLKK